MGHKFIKWCNHYYIVTGIGVSHEYFDPPDVYYAVPLNGTVIKSLISCSTPYKIPFSEAIEITDKNEIKSILILYGHDHDLS